MDTLRATCLGAAAVIDTVLLLALLEPRNWRRAMLPAFTLALGIWLWHAGAFSRLLLEETAGPLATEVRFALALVLVAGLLLIPGALLHLALRLRRYGEPRGPFSLPRAAAYLPLLLLLPAAPYLRSSGAGPLELPRSWIALHVAYLCAVGGFCAWELRRLRRSAPSPPTAAFAAAMAGTLTAVCAAAALLQLLAAPRWPAARPAIDLATMLLPLPPAILFAAYVIRHNVLELVIERTFVYAALLVGGLLFHHVTLGAWASALEDRFRVDFALIEGLAVLALIVAYQPLRQRAAEALRYLLGARVARERNLLRETSVQLSGLAGQAPEEIVAWFADRLQAALDLEGAGGWLLGPGDGAPRRSGAAPEVAGELLLAAHRELAEGRAATRLDPAGPAAAELLQAAEGSALIKLPDAGAPGLMILGRRRGNRDYSEEELNALTLLAEQLAGTLRTSRLQAERLAAERRALQSEKLSALGLLASSIAHEVKNPLSSIKTIATVLAEDLGPGSPHARDLKLILDEVGRLSARTSQLLEFARPPRERGAPVTLAEVVEQTLAVLRHLARQRDVALRLEAREGLPPVAGDEASLKEIVFNLLSNAVDAAAGPGAALERRVDVLIAREDGRAVLAVSDTGPGIASDILNRIFDPFFSTKDGGTGLGLYV
ncbi:MAG: hypothetical protein HY721_21495, partial [Planctomycetes bacterium]|nr:hypothetical protein [Planctomycetota bacterium]